MGPRTEYLIRSKGLKLGGLGFRVLGGLCVLGFGCHRK